MRLLIHRIRHWEYWPTWVIYSPIFFAYLFYALRARNLFYFSASNPSFKNGGLINVSKKDIYDIIPKQYCPRTILIKPTVLLDKYDPIKDFELPFIVKPDKGLRGIMVKKINSLDELKKYHDIIKCPYLIQELISFEHEIGVFYVRNPKLSEGTITGIVEKKFLTIVGDGISSIQQLLKQDVRYEIQIPKLKKDAAIDLQLVLKKNEQIILVPFGNHNRGTLFLDASDKITPKLSQTIDAICKQINGFYYGRLDLKFNSWDDLENGMNLSIIEINGALSEPAHIYDPKHSLYYGISEILRHQKMMFEVSIENHRLGTPYLSFLNGFKELNTHFKEVSLLRNGNKKDDS